MPLIQWLQDLQSDGSATADPPVGSIVAIAYTADLIIGAGAGGILWSLDKRAAVTRSPNPGATLLASHRMRDFLVSNRPAGVLS